MKTNPQLQIKLINSLIFFLVVFFFTTIAIPYLISLHKDHVALLKKYRIIGYSEKILNIIIGLIENDVSKIKENIDKLEFSIKEPQLYDKWVIAKDNLEDYLLLEVPHKEDLIITMVELFKFEDEIFQYINTIGSLNYLENNLLLAHYIQLKQIVLYYLKNGFISPYIIEDYIKFIDNALQANTKLKIQIKDVRKKLELPYLDIQDVFKIDSLSLRFLRDYIWNQKENILFNFYIIFFISFLCFAGFIFYTWMAYKFYDKMRQQILKNLEFLSKGEYEKIKFEIDENKCPICKVISDFAKCQKKQIEELKNNCEKLIKGKMEDVLLHKNLQKTDGSLKEVFVEIEKLANYLVKIKEKIELFDGILSFFPNYEKEKRELFYKDIKGNWRLLFIQLERNFERLCVFYNKLRQDISFFNSGEIKKILEEKSLLEEGSYLFMSLLKDIKEALVYLENNKLNQILIDERSKGDFVELRQNINKIFRELLARINELETKLKVEEELRLFLETIQKDKDVTVISERIKNLLVNKFKLKRFVFLCFEENINKFVIQISYPEEEFFCNKKILNNPDFCRCKRLGKIIIDKLDTWGKVCSMFNEDFRYVCLPFFFEDKVKCVLNIVCKTEKELNIIEDQIEIIRKFLQQVMFYI